MSSERDPSLRRNKKNVSRDDRAQPTSVLSQRDIDVLLGVGNTDIWRDIGEALTDEDLKSLPPIPERHYNIKMPDFDNPKPAKPGSPSILSQRALDVLLIPNNSGEASDPASK